LSLRKRGNTWVVDYYVNGKRVQRSVGPDKKLAEAIWSDIKVKKYTGQLFPERKVPLGRFLDEYLAYSETNKSAQTYKTDIGRIKIFRDFLERHGVQLINEITPPLIEKFKAERSKVNSVVTVNRYIQLAKALVQKTVEWGYLQRHPLKTVKELKKPQRKVEYFTQDQVKAILRHGDSPFREMILFFLYTGMRRSELIYLEWSDIDLKNEIINVQSKDGFHPKSYKPRSIEINPELRKVLDSLPSNGNLVFGNGRGEPLFNPKTIGRRFKMVLEKAGIDFGSLHTLRHTFASHLVMEGVDLKTVQEFLGHASLIEVQKYAHLSPEHRRKAIARLKF